MSYRTMAIAGLVLLLAVPSSHGAVLCAKKSGALKLRETCKRKETQVDPVALGLQGPPGAKGDQGDPGPMGVAGPAGTAVAYATVFYNGQIIGGKNTNQMSISHPSAGVYCFNLAFTPKHVQATLETGATIRATLDAGSVGGCSDTDEAAVLTFEFLPGEDHGFSILFE